MEGRKGADSKWDKSVKPSQEPSVQAYVQVVRSSEALHSEISRGLAINGFTASQFSAMKVLRIHGKLAQRDIAKYILKSCGNITLLVDHLEQEGLVTRARDTKDRRIVYVSLTSAGEEAFDGIYPGHIECIREAMAPLTDEECLQLTALLQKITRRGIEVACPPAARLSVVH